MKIIAIIIYRVFIMTPYRSDLKTGLINCSNYTLRSQYFSGKHYNLAPEIKSAYYLLYSRHTTDGVRKLAEPDIQQVESIEKSKPPEEISAESSSGIKSVLITAVIIISGMIIVGIFKDDINQFGVEIMRRYGQVQVDIILYFITAISASPLVLPIWQYVMIGVAMGYSVIHLAIVMGLGSATGSVITYYVGRYFGNSKFVKKKFPKAQNHPWVEGRSKWFVTGALFLGTASPIPFDILYFACGFKHYPVVMLFIACTAGRIIRYLYLGYGFDFFSRWM